MNQTGSWARLSLVTLVLLLTLVSGCATLPPRPMLDWEAAAPPASTGEIARFSEQFTAAHRDGISGFKLLTDAQQALEARLAITDLATSSIDLQYFIWQGDAVGSLLFNRLLHAADRGVKVRLLVDDIGVAAKTRDLIALNSHPNLEIRVYNPNPSRDYTIGAALHFLASMKELNRRMHNKLMIVDNHISITGGRNIGNPYFGLGKKYNFIDVDVISIGAVIEESSYAFDKYWNNEAAFPVSGWKVSGNVPSYDEMRVEVAKLQETYTDMLDSYPLEPHHWDGWLKVLGKDLNIGEAHFLQDDPVKIAGRDFRLIDMIGYLADPSEEEFILASPYFIPVNNALKELTEANEEGIEVSIITNSLASTNHTIVNSHYKKYRRSILATGSELYEFRHQPSEELRNLADVPPVVAPFVSFHAKVVVSDRRKCFIGSLNFDPRALVINSENGLLIESEILAAELTEFLEEIMLPENSYQVVLNDDGHVEWRAEETVLTGQPSRGLFQGLADFFGRFLPIESQL